MAPSRPRVVVIGAGFAGMHCARRLKNEPVDVTIVDRGPFVRGRIVDVSRGAARKIGLIQRGVGRVRIARL